MSEVPRIGPPVPETLSLDVTSVTIIAGKVVIGKEKPEPSEDERRRLLENSFLLAVLLLLVTLWFTAHLKTVFAGTILLGTATLWSIFQMIVARLSEPLAADADTARKRWLAGRSAKAHLCFFIALALAFAAATSSVHVKRGSASTPVEIRVLEGQQPGPIPTIRLTDDVKISGAPMLSGYPARRITLQVTQPSGYHPRELVLGMGEPQYLAFPDDFEKQTLVRIYVPFGLLEKVPSVGADKHARTVLDISAAKRLRRLSAYNAESAVYIGVKQRATADALIERAVADFAKAQHARFDGRVDESDFASYLTRLGAQPVVVPDWSLNKRDSVTATVLVAGKPVLRCTAAVQEQRINDCEMQEVGS